MAGKHVPHNMLRARHVHLVSQPANILSADEPARRSGRATKGQYTKDRDISEDLPATKKKGKGKASKSKATEQEPEEEEEDENIRCICGEYDPDEEGRAMICCDECEAWQHNDCMGLADDYAPDKYFCEIHAPQDHKELLAAMARGERPWEENRKRLAAPKKKPGKKGRKSGARVSEVPSHASQEVVEVRVESPPRGGQNKRKLEESPMALEMKVRTFESCHPHSLTRLQDVKKARATPSEPDTKPARQRKSTSMATPARSMSMSGVNLEQAPKDIEEISNAARKNTAGGLIKLFIAETKDAVKLGTHTLPVGVSVEAAGTQLALRVEYALYMIKSAGSAGDPSPAYKDQVKLLLPNVKRNHELRDKVLSGEVSETQLATMAAVEMASEEQQLKDAEIIKKSEKQHTIIEEQAPRIRRTHKGEEFVNEADQIAAESTENRASKPSRRESGIDQDGDSSMNDPDNLSPRETDAKLPRLPGNRSRPPQRQSSSNFDISNVWETVTVQGSPDTSNHQFPELPQQREPGGPVQEPAGPGVGDDADIDRLLKDEDAESEPYSPKDTADGEDIIWSGVINGNALGRFNAGAKYAAGATPDALHLTWQSLIPRELPISGRIDPAKANEYLCGLQYSTTSDVIVVTVTQPDNGNLQDALEFDRVFKYFKERKRYGVITQQAEPAIKDIYLIPLDQGDDLPEMLKLLEEKTIGDEHGRIVERMLMIPIVIKNTELPHMANMPPTPTMQQTPITPYDEATFTHLATQYPHQTANGTPTPLQGPNQYYANPLPPYSPTQAPNPGYSQGPPPSPLAIQILGTLAHAPAVAELLRRVPTVDGPQLDILREICRNNAAAAQDLGILTAELQSRGEQNQNGRGSA
jgi:hypothetical protein